MIGRGHQSSWASRHGTLPLIVGKAALGTGLNDLPSEGGLAGMPGLTAGDTVIGTRLGMGVGAGIPMTPGA